MLTTVSLICHCHTECAITVCTHWATGNRCAVHRLRNTWCLATTHHAIAPHTITHTANRCHVQRRTTNSNIWVLDQPWMPESSERPHTANTSRMQQCCHVCRTQVLMGIWIVKRPSWAQRQAETQPNVSHPLKSPPTRMLLHQHCVYVRVCEWECGRVMPRCRCLCGFKGLTEPLQAKKKSTARQ